MFRDRRFADGPDPNDEEVIDATGDDEQVNIDF